MSKASLILELTSGRISSINKKIEIDNNINESPSNNSSLLDSLGVASLSVCRVCKCIVADGSSLCGRCANDLKTSKNNANLTLGQPAENVYNTKGILMTDPGVIRDSVEEPSPVGVSLIGSLPTGSPEDKKNAANMIKMCAADMMYDPSQAIIDN